MRQTEADPSAADLADTVRVYLTWIPPGKAAAPKAALDALVDEVRAAERRVALLETALREIIGDLPPQRTGSTAQLIARAALEGGGE